MAKKKSIDRETNRYGMFMSENSFELEMMYGRDYLKKDVNFFIRLFRINIIETKSHKLYGQAKPKNKSFFPPVQLDAMVDIEDNQQNYLGGQQGLVREDSGKITIGIFLKELEEKNTEINRGDIVEYNQSGDKPRYYEVENANNVTDTTEKTIAGMRPYYRLVTAIPVKSDVVQMLKDDELI